MEWIKKYLAWAWAGLTLAAGIAVALVLRRRPSKVIVVKEHDQKVMDVETYEAPEPTSDVVSDINSRY